MRIIYYTLCLAIVLSSCIGDEKAKAQEKPPVKTEQQPSPNPKTQKATSMAKPTMPLTKPTKPAATQQAETKSTAQIADHYLGKSVSTLATGCDLVSKSFVANLFGLEEMDISLKESGRSMEHGKACFYKWNKAGVKDAGMFIQVQQNPMPEEFPEWAAYYIKAKVDHGDKTVDNSNGNRYKTMSMLGKTGAYNYELGRYIWRTDEGNIFMVAFNLDGSDPEYLLWAEKLGKEAMKNFY